MKQAADTTFSSGDARVSALRNRPVVARAVAARRALLRQADREHAIGLATVRNAAQLTQAELASVLGVGQAAVAKMERRPDLLLSTLRAYINGAGGHARLVVDFPDGGRRVELDLDTIEAPPEAEDVPVDEQSTEYLPGSCTCII